MKLPRWSALMGVALGLAACEHPSEPANDADFSRAQGSRGVAEIAYEITHLPSIGGTVDAGNAINNRGWVAGSTTFPGGDSAHAVLWRDGTPLDLGTLGGPNSSVAWPGISDNGARIVGIAETAEPGGETWACQFFFPSATGNRCLGFIYESGEMRAIPPWPGGTNGFATGVNNRGQVVGWAENGVRDPTCNSPVVLQFRAFLLDTRTDVMTELVPLPGDSVSSATAINDRGQIVGISGDCADAVGGFSARHAVLWESDGTAIDIGNLGGEAWHTPMDINERGGVVGFGNPDHVPGDDFGIQAFYWSRKRGIVSIGVLEGQVRSQALGINNRGQVVGQSSGGPEGRRAFLWEDGVLMDLNDLAPRYEGTLLYAGHINDAGVITGLAADPESGAQVAFVARPIGAHR